jgi:hypothetical protein
VYYYLCVSLTDDHDVSENRVAADGGAVPAVVPELEAALERADASALADGRDRVGRRAAQVALTRRQAGDATADHVRAQRCHHTRNHPETHNRLINYVNFPTFQ